MPAESSLKVVVDADGAVVVSGEIDMATFDELSTQIRGVLEDVGPMLVLDLAGVEFMDSSGLRVLLEANEACAARDRVLVLRSPSAAVRRLLDLTGLTDELRIT